MAGHPQPDRDDQRQGLETQVAARERNYFFPEIFHGFSKSRSAERSLVPSMFSVTLPPTTSAAVPSCSETTIATASVSSVTPRAARCRVPHALRKLGLVLSGQSQRTAATRPLSITTPPPRTRARATNTPSPPPPLP